MVRGMCEKPLHDRQSIYLARFPMPFGTIIEIIAKRRTNLRFEFNSCDKGSVYYYYNIPFFSRPIEARQFD